MDSPHATHNNQEGAGRARVLLVEDNEQISKLVAMHLRDDGIEVITAANGFDGLALAGKEKPDLILLDILMPDMSGFEVLKRLKANPATVSIPVVILSVLWEGDEVHKALQLGAVDFIVKSNVPLAALINRIEKYLPGGSAGAARDT